LKNWKAIKSINSLLDEFTKRYPAINLHFMKQALDILIPATAKGHRFYICGNGGSDADASHIVGELMKGFIKKRPYDKKFTKALIEADPNRGKELAEKLQQGIPAFSLNSHSALISAFANDVSYEMAFAQQLAALGKSGDVLWCLSTSGNSVNVLYAVVAAKAKGMKILSMTGESGGQVKKYSDCCITVPEKETFKVQEYHLPIYHCLCLCLEEYMFGELKDNE
jgi:D-sedoheptulose 7-phosphate isomerase